MSGRSWLVPVAAIQVWPLPTVAIDLQLSNVVGTIVGVRQDSDDTSAATLEVGSTFTMTEVMSSF